MTLKFFAGVLSILLGTVSGKIFSKKYKRKYEFFVCLESFAIYLKREIMFASLTLNQISSSFNSKNDDINLLLSYAFDGEITFPDFLDENQKNLISQFFCKIGRSDKKNEVELISSFIKEINAYRNEEEKKYKKYTSISVKIGFFAGLVGFILII